VSNEKSCLNVVNELFEGFFLHGGFFFFATLASLRKKEFGNKYTQSDKYYEWREQDLA
jgi:hypothetical protein